MNIQEMKEFVEELRVRTEIMKQLRELHKLDEGTLGGSGGGHEVRADQGAALFKEMKELVDELKTQRQKAKTDGGK